MSKLWDDLKQNLNQWSSAAVVKAEEMSKIAVAKTEELTRISKIKIEIRQLLRDVDKTYEEIGRLVSDSADKKVFDFKGNEGFDNFRKKLAEIKQLIEEKEKKIRTIKEEYGIKESEIESSVVEEKTVEEPEVVVAQAEEEKPKKKAARTPQK